MLLAFHDELKVNDFPGNHRGCPEGLDLSSCRLRPVSESPQKRYASVFRLRERLGCGAADSDPRGSKEFFQLPDRLFGRDGCGVDDRSLGRMNHRDTPDAAMTVNFVVAEDNWKNFLIFRVGDAPRLS